MRYCKRSDVELKFFRPTNSHHIVLWGDNYDTSKTSEFFLHANLSRMNIRLTNFYNMLFYTSYLINIKQREEFEEVNGMKEFLLQVRLTTWQSCDTENYYSNRKTYRLIIRFFRVIIRFAFILKH